MALDGGASEAGVLTTPPEAVVETATGKVRGARRDGVSIFKGVPYAATTAGEGRFRAPKPHAAWPGVRSALAYGPVCPQVDRAGWQNDESAFLFDWDDGFPGEDCLRLNIWTPGAGARPVMVWIHGGGYEAGSSQELPAYDGERLARRGDVVVVSVNHRLGVFGYLNLAGLGAEDMSLSANAGQLDLVAALSWVRANIGGFGGDPGNVTVFGQSGGAAKINALMAMPCAKGLFHKAILMSGSQLAVQPAERSDELARGVLTVLDLSPGQVHRLAKTPVRALIAAGVTAVKGLSAPPEGTAWGRMAWQPTVDGAVIPRQTWTPGAPEGARDIPILVGSTVHEFCPALGNPAAEAMDWAAVMKALARTHGERAEAVAAVFRAGHPDDKPVEILARINSGGFGRVPSVAQARRKAEQGGAGAWLYWFGWKTPVLDGRPRAFHCSDLAFAFDNIDRCLNHTGGGAAARALAARMSDAWIAFARHGDPNHAGLPAWAPVSGKALPTMMFDDGCAVADDPDVDERRALRGD